MIFPDIKNQGRIDQSFNIPFSPEHFYWLVIADDYTFIYLLIKLKFSIKEP